MNADAFEDLVLKYLDGAATPEDGAELNRLLKSDPAKADLFVRISADEAWLHKAHGLSLAEAGAADFETIVLKYLDGRTTPEEEAELNRRIKSDRKAAEFFVRIAGTESWVRARHEAEIPEGELVEEPVRRPRPAPRRSFLPYAAAAAVVVAALGFYLFRPAPPEPIVRRPRPVEAPKPAAPPPRNAEETAREDMARIEEETKRSQQRLAEIEQRRREAGEEERRLQEEARKREEAELARIEERRREAEKALEKARQPQPPPPEPPRETTVAAAAKIERVEGDVGSAKAGQLILPGQGVETEERGLAILSFADGTRIELGPHTIVREIQDADSKTKGKRLFIAQGTVSAEIVKQPADKPMIVVTPQGDARILGTTLEFSVTPAGTRVDVKEGRVRFTRSDGKSVDVAADHYAVVSPGTDLKSISRRVTIEDFDRMPAWTSMFDGSWGVPAEWSLVPGQAGTGLLATIKAPGASSKVLVFTVPAQATVDVSGFMRCPRASGGFFMELGFRLGEHTAEDFDKNPASWTMVKKFDSFTGANGNGNVWTRYSRKIATGPATRLTVGWKFGSTSVGDFTGAWDTLRISY